MLCTTTTIANETDESSDEKKTIYLDKNSFSDKDYLSNTEKIYYEPTLTRTPGDLIYEYYYLELRRNTSVSLGVFLSENNSDRFTIEWDGATQYDPELDIIIENLADGSQVSIYDWVGFEGYWPIHANRGSFDVVCDSKGYYKFWLQSRNKPDVTFYRVSILDAAD